MRLIGIKEDPPRSGRFYIRFRDQHGKDRREWCGPLEEAQARLKLRHQQVEDGTFRPEMLGRWVEAKSPESKPRENVCRLVGDVIEEVIAESLATLRAGRQDRRLGEEWKRELGTRTLDEVTPEDIKRWRRHKQSQISEHTGRPFRPGSINKFTAFLSKVFTHAVDNGYTKNHPVRSSRRGKYGFRPLDDDVHEDKVLLREQQAMLARTMAPFDYRIVVLAIETGMRESNLFGCRREWIDLKRRVIRVPSESFKGKRVHHVKLNRLAVRILAEVLFEHDSEWLFPSEGTSSGHLFQQSWYLRRWLPALEKAGIPPMKFHAMRATCATRMFEAGATVEEVRQQLGHSTITMVMRYARIVETHRSEVMERMAADSLSTMPPSYDDHTGLVAVILGARSWDKFAKPCTVRQSE